MERCEDTWTGSSDIKEDYDRWYIITPRKVHKVGTEYKDISDDSLTSTSGVWSDVLPKGAILYKIPSTSPTQKIAVLWKDQYVEALRVHHYSQQYGLSVNRNVLVPNGMNGGEKLKKLHCFMRNKESGVNNMRSIRWLLLGISIMLLGLCLATDAHSNVGAVQSYIYIIGFLVSLGGLFVRDKNGRK